MRMKRTRLIRLVLVTTVLAALTKKDLSAQSDDSCATGTITNARKAYLDLSATYAPDDDTTSTISDSLFNYTRPPQYFYTEFNWPVFRAGFWWPGWAIRFEPGRIVRGGFGGGHFSHSS